MRTILVTGASRGIGRGITMHLLERGYQVVGLSRNPGISGAGERYQAVSCDLSDLDTIGTVMKEVIAHFPDLDGLVSNAGVPAFGHIEQYAVAEIERLIHYNLTSHLVLARATLPHFKRLRRGDLVVMGSESAVSGGKQGAVYCAAKFGLRGMAQALREECAPNGVRVSLINPGMVRTSFFDQLQFEPGPDPTNVVTVQDIAATVETVLSAAAGTVFDEIRINPLKRVVQRK